MATNKTQTTKNTFEERKVKPKDDVKIIWVGDKWHEADSEGMVHSALAEKLIMHGKAYLPGKKPAPKEGGKNA